MGNSKHYEIFESLHKNRTMVQLNEAVSDKVKSAVKDFFIKTKTPANVKGMINDTLNLIYVECNKCGKNDFVGGNYSYRKGWVGEDGDGECGLVGPDVGSSVHSVEITIRFDDFDASQDAYDNVIAAVKKAKKYKKAFNIGPEQWFIFLEDEYASDFSIMVARGQKELHVEVVRNISPLAEAVVIEAATPEEVVSKLGKIKSEIKGKVVLVNFSIDKFHKKLIDAGWSFDSKLSNKNPGHPVYHNGDITISLSGNGRKTSIHIVESVMEGKKYTKQELETLCGELHDYIIKNGNKYLANSLYISGKYIKAEIDGDWKHEHAVFKNLVKDFFKSKNISIDMREDSEPSDDDSYEAVHTIVIKESALDTEVGLPIDKENCENAEPEEDNEGTDVGSVSTPSGRLGKSGEVIKCPKCGSESVNIRDGMTLHCTDCDNEWEYGSADGEETGEDDEITLEGKNVSEGVGYKKGKRYKTDDGMFFVVKKINKDGTIRVYDEDVEKEYDYELSDLELLHPTLVKEGIETLKECTKGKVVSNFYWGLHKGDAVYVRRVDNIKAGMFEVYDSKGNLKTTTRDKEELEECTDIKYSSLK